MEVDFKNVKEADVSKNPKEVGLNDPNENEFRNKQAMAFTLAMKEQMELFNYRLISVGRLTINVERLIENYGKLDIDL